MSGGQGEVVVGVVEFRMFVGFKPREFHHMTSLTPSKRRRFFRTQLTRKRSQASHLNVLDLVLTVPKSYF